MVAPLDAPRRCRLLGWIKRPDIGHTAGGVTSKTEGTVVGYSLAFNGKHIGNCTTHRFLFCHWNVWN